MIMLMTERTMESLDLSKLEVKDRIYIKWEYDLNTNERILELVLFADVFLKKNITTLRIIQLKRHKFIPKLM